MGGKDGMFRYADSTDKLLMLFGALGSIGDGLQYPLMMYVLSHVINEFGNPNVILNKETVDRYSLKLLYVAIAVGFSAFVEGMCWTRTAERQTSRMRTEYLKSVLRQEVGFFDTQEAGTSTTYQVVSTISNDANAIQVAICDKIPNCLMYMSTFVFCLGTSFVLSWKLTLAALPLTVMFIVPGLVFGKLMMDTIMKMIGSYAVAGGIVEQAISSIRTVYSYVAESHTLDRFSSALQNTMELGIKMGFAKGLMMGSMGIIYVGWAFQAWIGTYLVTEKGEKGGSIFVAGINVIMGGLSVLGALPNLTSITEAKLAATRIFEMMDRNPSIDSEDKKGKALSYVRGEIEFKDIYFSYPSRPDTAIFQGLNLTIPAGRTVGLVGGSGSGKSTIISLLQRFYDPIEGEVLLDGYKIRRLQLKWLRSQMGLVNQEPVLFATSIKENILFGKEGASMDDVISSAKAANAHDFIVKLPDGYETQVGQFGFQMSGGQKQRIAIARAVIRDPKILLLDEATSALDTQSERLVQEAIDQASKGRTTITIAHRLSTIRTANVIVVLQEGRVIESGSHQELMQINDGQGGEYNRMVQLQQMAAENEAPNDFSYNNDDPRKFNKMNVAPSPISIRSTAKSTPGFHPFSPAFSFGTPYSYSVAYDPDDDSADYGLKGANYPAPSQWRLLKMNAPEWSTALIGSLAAIGSGAVQPINAYCVGSLIANYFRTDKSAIKHKSRILSFVFLGIAVLNFISGLLQHYNFAVMGEKLTERVREKLLAKLMTFEIGWFDDDNNTSAAICAKFATEANMVRSLVGDRMSLLVQAIFGSILAYAIALVLSWRLALVMIAVQPLVVGSYYLRSVLMKSMAGKAQKAQKEGSQVASEAVINHRTITAFSSQKRILGIFKNTLKGPKEESVKHAWLSGFGLFSAQFFNTASTALAYWYGGRLLTDGSISPEHLFQAFLILLFTAYVIAEAGSMTNDLSKGGDAIRAVFAILDRKSEIDPENSFGSDIKKEIRGRVDVKNVFFAYPSRPDQMIFKGLNVKIDSGKTVALVGPSGSGKSTIIGLIERFYDPIKGSVLIDGQDVKNYNLRMLRAHIALVSQEPTLFAGTIRENIAYGKQNARESEIRKAARRANADEFISGMKDGYDTYCGERGVQLSGGQKQRIALARAILKNPSILLLDEATSALDSVSENLVQEALEKMMVGRTCVVIAHRLSTIQKSNIIAVLKNGRIVEEGSHNELMSSGRGGVYHSLVKGQSSSPYR
ncbi:putative multidrug resistance protein [Mercurialis annua]|uniref:putative multidrug resistance protein n=1 Tax=Mercurialis annua TaxID=3986 RepID=UPI00215EA760|nr:putative multidrug resistance protein [Mercurialis annua]